jgi:hypothetical protein
MLGSLVSEGLWPEIVLMVLLVATTFHAFRLERALGVLRRDRAALETLVASFSESMRLAEDGMERLRGSADDAGRQIARHIEQARTLKSDLEFLTPRGEKVADRIEARLQQSKAGDTGLNASAARALAPAPGFGLTSKAVTADPDTRPRSQAERDLLMALRAAR